MSIFVLLFCIFLHKNCWKQNKLIGFSAQNNEKVNLLQTCSLGICRGIGRQMGAIVSFVGIYMIGLPLAVGLTMYADFGIKGEILPAFYCTYGIYCILVMSAI